MTRTRKPPMDPRIDALKAKEEKALVSFERSYQRLKRAFTAMEKARRTIKRCRSAVRRLSAELEASNP